MEHDFTIPQETLDTVPAEFRPLYAAGADGKFIVGEGFKPLVGAVVGLNTSLRAAREDAKKRSPVDLTPLAEFGSDPAAIKTAFDARVAELTAKGGDATKAVEKVRTEMAAANATALAASNAKTTAYQNQLYSYLVENTAMTAVTELKGAADLLMPFIKNQVKVAEEDGKFVVHVVDAAGERRYSGVTGQPLSIKELVTGMKADPKYGRLFESEQQPGGGGGGMPPGGGTRKGVPAGTTKTSADKIAAGLASRGGARPMR